MKNILFIFAFIVLCSGCNAQDNDSSYNVPIAINHYHARFDTNIVINLEPKFGLERKARFTGFFYDLDAQQLSLRWQITYHNNGHRVSINGVSFENRMQVANQSTFVDFTGNVIDTVGYRFPFLSEFDFYKFIAQRGTGEQNLTINQLIIAAGMRPGRWKD